MKLAGRLQHVPSTRLASSSKSTHITHGQITSSSKNPPKRGIAAALGDIALYILCNGIHGAKAGLTRSKELDKQAIGVANEHAAFRGEVQRQLDRTKLSTIVPLAFYKIRLVSNLERTMVQPMQFVRATSDKHEVDLADL